MSLGLILIIILVIFLLGGFSGRFRGYGQRKPTPNWSAYDYFLKGRELANAQKEDEAKDYFAQAILMIPISPKPMHGWPPARLLPIGWNFALLS